MKRLVTILALVTFAAAVVPTFAQAEPTPVSNDRAHYQLGPGEIPYLSQGVGVDEESLGAAVPSTRTGVAADDRPLPRSTPEPTPVIVTKDSGWNVDFGNPGFAALALMLGLLAGGTAVAMWSRRGRLTPA